MSNYEQSITCFKHEQELSKEPALRTQLHKVEKQTNFQRPFSKIFTQISHTKNTTKSLISEGLVIEAEALHGLGCVAQEMHDYERALKYHSSALTIAQEIGFLELESRAYGAIGSAYNALGK